MPETETNAGDVIDSYRRRRNRLVPLFVGGLAVVLLVVGVFLVVLWLTGDSPPALPSFLARDTPTPTATPTPPPPTETPTITNTPEASLTPTPSGPTEYIVEVGDTLFSIAETFSVTMDLLISYNGLTDPNNIGVGTTLLIPPPDSELPTETAVPTGLPRGSKIEYVVKTGDTLQSIAAKFNSTAEAIALENK
ncbi:MAG: LysM peptidoglycan-binding domain-containing protein, partial [Anaerolineales bacterium]|nr:LysM peptidoglycan-binding domain-containing protein [Anaerolineales bacterium]